MASDDNDISLPNSLIATTLDSVEGYSESAKDAEDPQLKPNFGERATRCAGWAARPRMTAPCSAARTACS